ncbi:hypothetical protein FHG87_009908 [Trinorchestia longiramus]|nr:hypothetical protein FHG87_009908 [Trinorchestia longiramus]
MGGCTTKIFGCVVQLYKAQYNFKSAASYVAFSTYILHTPHLTRTEVQPSAMKGTLISVLLLVAIVCASSSEENEIELMDTFAEADVIQRQLGSRCRCSGSTGILRFRCRRAETVLCAIRLRKCCGMY